MLPNCVDDGMTFFHHLTPYYTLVPNRVLIPVGLCHDKGGGPEISTLTYCPYKGCLGDVENVWSNVWWGLELNSHGVFPPESKAFYDQLPKKRCRKYTPRRMRVRTLWFVVLITWWLGFSNYNCDKLFPTAYIVLGGITSETMSSLFFSFSSLNHPSSTTTTNWRYKESLSWQMLLFFNFNTDQVEDN